MIHLTQDPYWHLNKKYGQLSLVHQHFNKEHAVIHFKQEYPDHLSVPSWVALRVQTFGTICKLLKTLSLKEQKAIAISLSLHIGVSYKQLYNVFNALRYLRNECTHNGKIIGRRYKIKPPIHPAFRHSGIDESSLTNMLFWIEEFMPLISTRQSFKNELEEIRTAVTETCPASMHF
jgi:abortive infection bacteriophage resistance protein